MEWVGDGRNVRAGLGGAQVLLGGQQLAPLRGEESADHQGERHVQQVTAAPGFPQGLFADLRGPLELARTRECHDDIEDPEQLHRMQQQPSSERPLGEGDTPVS